MRWVFLRRHVLAVMSLIAVTVLQIQRINLSIAIVAMTKSYPITLPNGTEYYEQEFDWDPEDEGQILGSYFYGYTMTQFLGGWAGMKFGGAKIFGAGLISSSLLTILTPIVITKDFYTLVGMRLLLGALQGVTFPAMTVIWSHWAPENEKTKLVSISLSGIPIGNAIGLSLCGILLDLLGWQFIFYITGALGAAWSVIWFLFVREKPTEDSWITEEELSHFKHHQIPSNNKVVVFPFGKMFTSPPVWAAVILSFCAGFGTFTMQTELPSFIDDVYHFASTKTGLVSSLPDMFVLISYITVGYVCDAVVEKGCLTITQIRKLFACAALCVQAVSMISITLCSDLYVVMFLFSIIKFMNGFSYSTLHVNALDLAPQYAGVLHGLINTFGTLAGSLSPLFCGYISYDKSIAEWHIVFLAISYIYLFGSVIYGLFGSGEIQPWATIIEDTNLT